MELKLGTSGKNAGHKDDKPKRATTVHSSPISILSNRWTVRVNHKQEQCRLKNDKAQKVLFRAPRRPLQRQKNNASTSVNNLDTTKKNTQITYSVVKIDEVKLETNWSYVVTKPKYVQNVSGKKWKTNFKTTTKQLVWEHLGPQHFPTPTTTKLPSPLDVGLSHQSSCRDLKKRTGRWKGVRNGEWWGVEDGKREKLGVPMVLQKSRKQLKTILA